MFLSQRHKPLPITTLPPPDYDNTFYIIPIFESWHVRQPSDELLRTQEAREMTRKLGQQRPYMRLGFAIISDGNEDATFALARKLGICLVLQGGATDHHITEWEGELLITGTNGDRRNAQWLNDGDYIALTAAPGFRLRSCLSIYCNAMHEQRRKNDSSRALHVSAAMKRFPDTVVATSGPIEVETQMEDRRFGDYSPYSIAEFRDWLTHRRIYDDRNGIRRGQGFPGGERWVNDPSPASHNGAGSSFNDHFDTSFTTWSLAYWDLDVFPDPLPLESKGMPQHGERGYTEGGFDAPRMEESSNPFWKAWSNSDLKYPGFRQILVRNWVSDSTHWLYASGVPKKRIFSHQVPGQSYGDLRLMLGASPAWTADTPDGSIGITTYFGAASDTSSFSQITELNPNWGIFEYHPYPIDSLAAPPNAYSHSLDVCIRFRSHILTPISWGDSRNTKTKDFIVSKGPFADAIHSLFVTLPDRPYNDRTSRQYDPPSVKGVKLSHSRSNLILSWSPYVWSGHHWRWENLQGFQGFDVWLGKRKIADTMECQLPVETRADYQIKVKWSEIPVVPPSPQRIIADNGIVRWNEPGGLFLKQFVIEYSANSNMDISKSVVVAANEFLLPMGEEEYYCRVCAMNGDGVRGAFSLIIKVVMPSQTISTIPRVSNVLAYGKNMTGKMLLTWSDAASSGEMWKDMPGFKAFCVYHGANRNFTPSKSKLMAIIKQNRYMDDHFNAEEPWYRVTALFQDGRESPPSDSVSYVP